MKSRIKSGGRFWTKTNMVRLYGWAERGQRLVDAAPHGHWNTSTPAKALGHAQDCNVFAFPICPTRLGCDSLACRNRSTGATMEFSLGSFGDVRLDKRGTRSSNRWW